MCQKMGRDTPANTVDHIVKHNGDPVKFWDENNLQSLCPSCHSGSKRHQENIGYSPGANMDGTPLDENHPWNKRR